MNGNGFTISNLTIQQSPTNDIGLFGATDSNAVIKFVILKNVNINTSDKENVGAIVGYNQGTIENSLAEGTVKGKNSVGGLVGYNSGNITFLLSKVTVEGAENVGGLIGYHNGGTIENASATKDVQGIGNNVGGLIGKSENGTIKNSTATGNVNGKWYIGGLVGQNTNGQITNAYATGDVSGRRSVGGLIGGNVGGTIENTFATGKVTGGTYIGGLVGETSGGSITNSYATGDVDGDVDVGGLVGRSFSKITKTYAKGDVTGIVHIGGLIGQLGNGETLNSFALNAQINLNVKGDIYIGEVIGKYDSNYPNFSNIYALKDMILNITNPNGVNGTDISIEEAQNQQTYVALGWDFNHIWKMDKSGYPTLQTTEGIGAARKSTVTLQSNFTNAGTLTGQGQYEPGTEVNLMAQPNTGYQFVNWTIDNVELNHQPTVQYTISPGDITIVANFKKISKMLTLNVNDPNGGTITKGASGSYEYDEEIELQATPKEGYRFVKWVINGTTEITDSTFTYKMPAQDVEIIAYFEKQSYEVTVKANDPKGGTVTGNSGKYLFEDQISLQATPNEGYRFVNWTVDGKEVSKNPTFTFTVQAKDVEILANFEKLSYYEVTVKANDPKGGTVTGNSGKYLFEDQISLQATPNEGYRFVNWTVNGTEVSKNLKFTYTVQATDAEIVAHFEKLTYKVTVKSNHPEGGSISGEGTYQYGENITLTATPNKGYRFINWTVEGIEVGTEPTFTYTIPAQNVEIMARFGKQSYKVAVKLNNPEGGTVSGEGTYEYGENVTLTATPNKGYRFVNWTINGKEVSDEPTFTYTVPAEDVEIIANFEILSFKVTAQANNPKAGKVSGGGTYEYGSQIILKATPNEGYRFVNWSINGKEVSDEPSFIYTVPAEDVTITANFEEIRPSIEEPGSGPTEEIQNEPNEESSILPKTAMHYMNWLLIGLAFILIGAFGYILNRKRNTQ
ncbi:GLUG motif-containing protein [Aeribacillus sp. FSL k6-2211]|uniref:InlB B-repeat-containing protein n=1 Tax=Aeribacillus sp. FSL k6-2211 TaxID=2954608 RepID=UPI0030CD0FDE